MALVVAGSDFILIAVIIIVVILVAVGVVAFLIYKKCCSKRCVRAKENHGTSRKSDPEAALGASSGRAEETAAFVVHEEADKPPDNKL